MAPIPPKQAGATGLGVLNLELVRVVGERCIVECQPVRSSDSAEPIDSGCGC
jgi:hypothetical protein